MSEPTDAETPATARTSARFAYSGPRTLSKDILAGSAVLWFVPALIGQWLFVLYILGVYGRLTLKGGLPAWTETPLENGYIPGDQVGNAALAVHIFLAIAVHGFGPLQLIPQIRDRFPTFHHWNGRIFLTICVTTSLMGLYLKWTRDAGFSGFNGQVAITIVALLIFAFAAQTIRFAVKRDIDTHHRWALRLFMVASAVWFTRLIIYGAIFVTREMGIERDTIWDALVLTAEFGQFIIPLTVLEIYLRAQKSSLPAFHYAAAGLVVISTLLMVVGLYAVMILAWLPRVGLL